MVKKIPLKTRRQLRTLRKARRYIRANQTSLARLMNTHARMSKENSDLAFWLDA